MAADTTRLVLDSSAVAQLPEGAVFTARKGRSHVSVSKGKTSERKPALVVEAGCDSLQRLVNSYERLVQAMDAQMRSMAQAERSQTAVERRLNPIQTMLEMFFAGLLVGVVLTILIRKIWKKVF